MKIKKKTKDLLRKLKVLEKKAEEHDAKLQAAFKIIQEFEKTRKAVSKSMKKKGLKPKDVENAIEDLRRNPKTKRLEDQHRKGYQTHPASRKEFSVWKKEQTWDEE